MKKSKKEWPLKYGFFKSAKDSFISDYFKLMYDIGGIVSGNAVDVALYDDHLELKDMLKHSTSLKYSQIQTYFMELKRKLHRLVSRA